MATFSSVQSSSLVEKAHRAIHQAILNGDLKPGSQLLEAAVAREMGISRGPVREALRLLERGGLVVHQPNKGYRVARFTPDDLIVLASIRLALESLALHRAIENPGTGPRLRAVLGEMMKAQKKGDRARVVGLDRQFHEAVVDMSGQARLLAVWLSLRDQIELAVAEVSHTYASMSGRTASHVPLVEAIEQVDLNTALEALEAHIFDAAVYREAAGLRKKEIAHR